MCVIATSVIYRRSQPFVQMLVAVKPLYKRPDKIPEPKERREKRETGE
jgi:hypothetical protein